MLRCFVLLLCAYGAVGYGYDSGGGDQASCGRPYRTGRNYQPPCDLAKNGYCRQAGQLYPWKAVRRFVKNNQGLMRRMYGDQRQSHVLRTELDPDILDEEWGQPTRNLNEWREPHHRRYSRHQQDWPEDDLDIDNELSPIPDEESSYAEDHPYSEPRYLKDDRNTVVDVLKTKFVYSQHEPAVLIKLAGLRAATRYRATTQRTTTTTSKIPTTERTTTSKPTRSKLTSSRTSPPRNSNPKHIYSARNTASTSTTTRKPTSARTTTGKSISATTIKSNPEENRRTAQPNTSTSETKVHTESSTVGTTKRAVYITRDSAAAGKGSGKNEFITTTEILSTSGTAESTVFTTTGTTSTEDYLNESTTDTTTSSDHFSTTPKNQTQTTTVRDNLVQKLNQTQPKPIDEQTATFNDRFDEDNDSIEVLSEKNSAEKVGSFTSVENLKSEGEFLKYTSDNFKENSDADDVDDISSSNVDDDLKEVNTSDNNGDENIYDAEVSASETNENKVDTPEDIPVDTMLFQDMEDDTNKKVTVNYNMKGVNACPVKEEVVAPFWANNTRGEVLALLNMYPFEQYVHWEKCTFEHRQMYCREGCRCEQQFRLHRLLAYDPNNECRGIFSDWFRFPSCCVCKCYNIPAEFRVTSRSPRLQRTFVEDEEDPDYDDNIT